MLVTHQQGNAHDSDCGHQRSYHRNKFQQPAHRPQHQRVRHPHQTEPPRIHCHRQRRQRELCADEMGQHLVQVAEHALQQFALQPRLDQIKQDFAEGESILQKENRQERNHHQQPRLLRHIRHVQSHGLRQFDDFVAMAGEIVPKQIDCLAVPAMLLAQLFRDLSGA